MTIEAGYSDNNSADRKEGGNEKGKEYEEDRGKMRVNKREGMTGRRKTLTFYKRPGLMEDLRSSEVIAGRGVTIFLIGHS